MDEPVWVPIVFTRNRERLLNEHFTVGGRLTEAWASQKSFQFHGEKRSNQTHQSKTDPDAKLYRKNSGSEARLSHLGHTLVENRSGLIVGTYLTEADGHAERDAALLVDRNARRTGSP